MSQSSFSDHNACFEEGESGNPPQVRGFRLTEYITYSYSALINLNKNKKLLLFEYPLDVMTMS